MRITELIKMERLSFLILINLLKFKSVFLQELKTCEHLYVSERGRTGTFSSPGFPAAYPASISCRYVFQGTADERIRISFLEFDLEPGTSAGCLFDYIDIFTIDFENVKNLEERLCGVTVPKDFVSVHQTVELTFKSDYTTSRRGFHASYEFIDEKWLAFPPSSSGCGREFLTETGGGLSSPGYPEIPAPNTQCTWMIRTDPRRKIMIHFLHFNLGNSDSCEHTHVAIFNGFASPTHTPDIILCRNGEMTEFVSKTFRVVIRFQVGNANDLARITEGVESFGFHISWTSFWVPGEGVHCNDFHCKGGEYCIDTSGLLCNPLPRYCISQSLRCNDVPNCGAYDPSDEDGCYKKTVLKIGASVASLIAFIILTILFVLICRSFRSLRANKSHRKSNGTPFCLKTESRLKKFEDQLSDHVTENGSVSKKSSAAHLIQNLDLSPSMRRSQKSLHLTDSDRGDGIHRARADLTEHYQALTDTDDCYDAAETEGDVIFELYNSPGSARRYADSNNDVISRNINKISDTKPITTTSLTVESRSSQIYKNLKYDDIIIEGYYSTNLRASEVIKPNEIDFPDDSNSSFTQKSSSLSQNPSPAEYSSGDIYAGNEEVMTPHLGSPDVLRHIKRPEKPHEFRQNKTFIQSAESIKRRGQFRMSKKRGMIENNSDSSDIMNQTNGVLLDWEENVSMDETERSKLSDSKDSDQANANQIDINFMAYQLGNSNTSVNHFKSATISIV